MLAVLILSLTGYYTGTEDRPVKNVGKTSLTGAATVVLAGVSVGLESAVYTAIVIAAAVYGAFLLGGSGVVGLFAIALAGCGLLTTVGVIVAMDTFGPVSDNAQGIAEMSGDVHGDGTQILTELDAVGNTTKAITKGIAISTAVLAATALFGSYTDAIHTVLADNYNKFIDQAVVFAPQTLVGLLIGAAVVFLFSGLAISAVGRAAGAVVFEVRRQFREIPGIWDGTGKPEYGKVVDICTKDSLRELATPGLLAICAPIAVGFGLGPSALAGYLAGAIATGTLMAVFLANSGGAWDNAKKLVEDGHHGGKGFGRPCGHGHRRYRRRPVQGHRRTGDQPLDQGDEPRLVADRASSGCDVSAEHDTERGALCDRGRCGCHHRRDGGHQHPPRSRDCRRARRARPEGARASTQRTSAQPAS